MEHRHHRHHAVGLAHPDVGLGPGAEGVEEGRAVAVDDALGLSRGSGRVAHRGGVTLVELRPGIAAGQAGQQLFVRDHRLQRARREWTVAHANVLANGGHLARHPLQGRKCAGVDEDHLVLGVLDDELQVLREEPQVEGVQHRTGARDGEVELQVTGVVPGERRHPVARQDPQLPEGVGQLGRPGAEVLVGVAVNAVFPPGDYLLPGKDGRRPPQEVPKGQREVRHRAHVVPQHGGGIGELRAGQLHPIAGIAGKADGDRLEFLQEAALRISMRGNECLGHLLRPPTNLQTPLQAIRLRPLQRARKILGPFGGFCYLIIRRAVVNRIVPPPGRPPTHAERETTRAYPKPDTLGASLATSNVRCAARASRKQVADTRRLLPASVASTPCG